MNELRSTALEFRQGNSDKVYHLNLEPRDGGFVVIAQYGRRGAALTQDDKTKNGPVDYAAAVKLFARVEREKIAKGYQPTGAPAPAVQIDAAPAAAAKVLACELLTEVTEREAAALVVNPDYWMQDKSDGVSRGAVKTADGKMFGLNKTGKVVPLPAELHAALALIPLRTFQIDAELVGDRLVCRDLLNADGDISQRPYFERFARLVEATHNVVKSRGLPCLAIVETWEGSENKVAALKQSRAECREGVVFKLVNAAYRPGRNGQHKKFKFVKTLSAIAGKPGATGKDSVQIFLYNDARELVRCGTVGLIGKSKVKEGDVIEVIYLYAFPSGLVTQARLSHVRNDVERAECTTRQLIYKREE